MIKSISIGSHGQFKSNFNVFITSLYQYVVGTYIVNKIGI